MPAATTAVIVDEWPLVRLGIAQAMRTAGVRVAGEAGQGEEGLGKAAASDPTFLVVGALRDMPVVDLVRRAAARHVVVLLDRPGRDELTAVLSAGAAAVLVRSSRPEEIADAVVRVEKGERVVAPMLLPLLVGAVTPADDDEPAAGGLTRKEVEVLTRLAEGLSNREIADAMYVTPATVKTHLAHIYAKLGVTGRQEAIARAVALGVLA
ncbi:MAG TPA: response regulator transcription factor [Acidimicrobiales bacterium]|nr:response regulator transcription factor [Acidimicrobiales bacterium]